MYALNLNAENRILSAYVVLPATPEDMPHVETLPEGDIGDWLYVDGEYVCDPLTAPEAALYADRNYETGEVATVDGTLYEFSANVARGCRIDSHNAAPTTIEAQFEKMKGDQT